jgi:phosphoglycolate phosphatase
MTARAILFDLDGTLVDSVADLAAAANRLLAEHQRPPLAIPAITLMVGDGAAKLVERALAASGLATLPLGPAVERFLEFYEADATTLTQAYPGAPATLAELVARGCRLAVCTNKPEAATRTILDGLDLTRFFAVIIGGDTLPVRKPDPAVLREAMRRLGSTPAETLMVGDHRNDLVSAEGAGIDAIFATFGYGSRADGDPLPLAEIAGFAELIPALGRLGRL